MEDNDEDTFSITVRNRESANKRFTCQIHVECGDCGKLANFAVRKGSDKLMITCGHCGSCECTDVDYATAVGAVKRDICRSLISTSRWT